MDGYGQGAWTGESRGEKEEEEDAEENTGKDS